MTVKYALYKYSTRNIGDEIQSVAARQFLPKVDYFIDRDKLGDWVNSNKSEKVRLIANAWYMGKPMSWPARDKTLDILPISMHTHHSDPEVNRIFSSRESVDFFKRYKSIGARDTATKSFFDSLGVASYFSACLTLTLQKDNKIEKAGFVLCVTVSDEVYEAVRNSTDRIVIRVDTCTFDETLDTDSRMRLAEEFLYLYQSAHYVVTTRLHAAFPCLALETPVTYITDSGAAKYDPSRLDGLKELTNNTTERAFLQALKGSKIEKPAANPKRHLKYRELLIASCEEFTGVKQAESFSGTRDFSSFKIEASDIFKTIILNYDTDRWRKDHELYLSSVRVEKLEQEVAHLSSTHVAMRKVLGNIRRKIV